VNREFHILVDTREQRPLCFREETPTERATLKEGDYTARGLEGCVAIERKSIHDLAASLTTGRERFLRELERLRPYSFKMIVVEGDLIDLVSGTILRSKAHPSALLGSVCAIVADGTPVVFASNARIAAEMVERILRRLHAAHVRRLDESEAA